MTGSTIQPFDPYRRWLGIPPAEQPADLYRLLGLAQFEADSDVIESGADRQMAHVQRHQNGPHSAASQKILNELARARIVLLDAVKKAAYDQKLRAHIAAAAKPGPAAKPAPASAAATKSAPGGAAPSASASPAASGELAFIGESRPATTPTASRKREAAARKRSAGAGGALRYGVPGLLCVLGLLGWYVMRQRAASFDAPTAASARAKPSAARNGGRATPPKPAAKASPSTDTASAAASAGAPAEPSRKSEPAAGAGASPDSSDSPARESSVAQPSGDSFDVGDSEGDARWWDVLNSTRAAPVTDQSPQFAASELNCVPEPSGRTRWMLGVMPPKEYVLRFTLTRSQRGAEVNLGLATGSSRFALIIDGWGERCTTTQYIDRGDGQNYPEAHQGSVLEPDREAEITIVVRQSGMALTCNQQRIFTYSKGIEHLGAGGELEAPNGNELFFAGMGGPFVVRRLRLRSLSGEEPTFLRATSLAEPPATPPLAGPLVEPQTSPVLTNPEGQVPAVQPTAMLPAAPVRPPAGLTLPLRLPPNRGHGGTIKPLKTLREAGGSFCSFLGLSPDGRYAVWGGNTGVLMDLQTEAKTDGPSALGGEIGHVAFTQNSKELLGLRFRSAVAWSPGDGGWRELVQFPPISGTVANALSADARITAASEPQARALSVIDCRTGAAMFRIGELPGFVTFMALSPHGRYLFATGPVAQAPGGAQVAAPAFGKVFDVATRRELPVDFHLAANPRIAAISDDGKLAFVSQQGQEQLMIFDIASNSYEQPIAMPDGERTSFVLDFTPDGTRLLRGDNAGSLRLWDIASHKLSAELIGHRARILRACVSADSQLAVSAGNDGVIYLWRLGGSELFAAPDIATLPPAPSEEEQQKSRAVLKDAFADDYAKARKSADKAALAQKLFGQAGRASAPAEKYVLLAEARDLARAAGEPALFFRTLETLRRNFAVDIVEQAATGAEGLARLSLSHAARIEMAEGLLPLVDCALAEDKLDAATKMLAAAASSARKAKDRELLKTVVNRQTDVKEQTRQAAAVQVARETLKNDGDDPAANLALGKYYCLTRNDWKTGLPYLQKSSVSDISAAAKLEIATPKSAAEHVALADAWFAIAEAATGRDKSKYGAHAAEWYRTALPRLEGLGLLKAKKRISELTETAEK